MTIKKKVHPIYFEKLFSGEKNFELRIADFECHEGDTLLLQEWDPNTKEYTGRELEKKVTYVLRTKDISLWPEEEVEKYGYQVISLK